VHAVRTLADAAALAEDLRVRRPETAVVVGSGYVGLEMAEALVARGLAVTVVERGPSAMASLDPDMGDLVAAAMRRAGITVHLDEHLVGIDDGAVTTSGGERPADLVVLGTGIEPDTSLAAGAGLALGVRDSIVVDRRQRTSAPGVYAAGDCAQSHHVVTGGPTWVALGTVANKQGRVAGINLAGGYATFPGVVGTAVTRVCAAEVGRTGLGAAEAEAAGFVVDTATVTGTTTAASLPSAEALTLKLVAERGSGRVLGMQVVGGAGSAKRVDAVAVALHAGMDVTDLIDLDLAYAPMFSPVWEPVQIAARELAGRAG
jgi:NADPH-dependent 2,4-dienoyl-CoA reductase/sulfur reductase-like enzyme